MKEHPCRNCLIISACKQKSWLRLHRDCSTLSSYIFDFDKYGKDGEKKIVRSRIQRTFNEIYPNYWKPAESDDEWTWVTDVVKR